MPHAGVRPCNVPGCSGKADGEYSRCVRHRRNAQADWNAKRNPVYERFYTSEAWSKLSRRVRREEPICRGYPVPGSCRRRSQHTDHIVAMHDGGDMLDRTNLQALCDGCHGRKSADERRSRARAARTAAQPHL